MRMTDKSKRTTLARIDDSGLHVILPIREENARELLRHIRADNMPDGVRPVQAGLMVPTTMLTWRTSDRFDPQVLPMLMAACERTPVAPTDRLCLLVAERVWHELGLLGLDPGPIPDAAWIAWESCGQARIVRDTLAKLEVERRRGQRPRECERLESLMVKAFMRAHTRLQRACETSLSLTMRMPDDARNARRWTRTYVRYVGLPGELALALTLTCAYKEMLTKDMVLSLRRLVARRIMSGTI